MSYARCNVLFYGQHGITDVRALVPRSEAARVEGLRNCRFLPDGSGMLFEFPGRMRPVLTMSDMKIPLDIIFLSAMPNPGVVMSVVRAHPGQERIYGPSRAEYALEVPCGWAQRHRISPITSARIV